MPRAGGRAQGLVGTTESASAQAQSIAQSHTGRETMTVYTGTSDGSAGHPPCPGGYFHSAPGERALSVEASGGWLTAVCRLLGFRLML